MHILEKKKDLKSVTYACTSENSKERTLLGPKQAEERKNTRAEVDETESRKQRRSVRQTVGLL